MKTTLSMGRRVPLVLLLLVVAAGAFLQGNTGLASRTPGTPKIVCDAPTAEWGDLIKGDPYEHVFQIKNTGDEVLIIQKVNGT